MTRAKQLFAYAGGKTKLLKLYDPFFQGLRPEHCIDYFGGSGGMTAWFYDLYPHAKFYLNENDPAIYELFRCIKEQYESFIESLQFWEKCFPLEGDTSEERKGWYYAHRDVSYNKLTDQHDFFTRVEKWLNASKEELKCRYVEIGFGDDEDSEGRMLQMIVQDEIRHYRREKEREDPDFEEDYCEIDGKMVVVEDYFFFSGYGRTAHESSLYYLLCQYCYNGRNARNKFGEYKSAAGTMKKRFYHLDDLTKFKALLDQSDLFSTDYRKIDLPLPKSLHYFDPPYVSSAKLFFSAFGWDKTEELCEYMQHLAENHTVFMSNYEHPRLKKLLKGFQWTTFPAAGGMQRKRKKDPVREILFYKIHPSIAG